MLRLGLLLAYFALAEKQGRMPGTVADDIFIQLFQKSVCLCLFQGQICPPPGFLDLILIGRDKRE